MAGEINSPNMNLVIPQAGPGGTLGPQYALDVNSSLSIIDQHNHSAGSGSQINPNGININSDLPFNDNNLTTARSLRLFPQSSPLAGVTDLGCLYESGVDLWFNDGSGNQIRITQSGGIAGSPGSIANLTPPASASYVSGTSTFVWQSAANTPANLDAASIVLRNLVANSFGLTLNPPSLSSDYQITLPHLPGVTSVVTIDNSGNEGTQTYNQVGQNMTSTGANAIRASMSRTTGTTVGLGGVAVSTSCGAYTSNSGSPTDVTNLTVTITTSGRPVMLMLAPDGTSNSIIRVDDNTVGTPQGIVSLVNVTTAFGYNQVISAVSGSAVARIGIPPSAFNVVDMTVLGAPGTYTYKVQASVSLPGTTTFIASFVTLVAYEIS